MTAFGIALVRVHRNVDAAARRRVVPGHPRGADVQLLCGRPPFVCAIEEIAQSYLELGVSP